MSLIRRQTIISTNADLFSVGHHWEKPSDTFQLKYKNFIQQNAFETVIWKRVAILSRGLNMLTKTIYTNTNHPYESFKIYLPTLLCDLIVQLLAFRSIMALLNAKRLHQRWCFSPIHISCSTLIAKLNASGRVLDRSHQIRQLNQD